MKVRTHAATVTVIDRHSGKTRTEETRRGEGGGGGGGGGRQ